MAFYILPGAVICLLLGLAIWFLRSCDLRRRPVMFGQATVVALGEGTASFELFDGQVIELSLSADTSLHVGDYGRLTYRAGRFLRLE